MTASANHAFDIANATGDAMRQDGIDAPARAGCRVLLAEDNPVNQQVALRLLDKLGCLADVADNGRQAVEMLRTTHYDLVLMDCEMPDMDGYQATQCIRAMGGEARNMPVVALTASTDQNQREKCLASGMSDFLSKPIREHILREVLRRWLPPRATPTSGMMAVPGADELDAMRAAFGDNFRELAALYRIDTPSRIALLREAYAVGNMAEMATLAHALAGSSASLGAWQLSALCKDLEARVKACDLADFDVRMAAVEAEYRRIDDRLNTILC